MFSLLVSALIFRVVSFMYTFPVWVSYHMVLTIEIIVFATVLIYL